MHLKINVEKSIKIGGLFCMACVMVGTIGFALGRYGKSISLFNVAFGILVLLAAVLLLQFRNKNK